EVHGVAEEVEPQRHRDTEKKRIFDTHLIAAEVRYPFLCASAPLWFSCFPAAVSRGGPRRSGACTGALLARPWRGAEGPARRSGAAGPRAAYGPRPAARTTPPSPGPAARRARPRSG